jgi:N6-L-threonylcarbamoyladenine synthase
MPRGVQCLVTRAWRPRLKPWLRQQPLYRPRGLLTLAIETSCDDTAVAVVEKLGNQGTLHFNKKITSDNSQYGGIHPLQAQESHERNLAILLVQAWNLLKDDLKRQPDFISVTRGPGMYHNLREGLATAKGISVASGIPIIGVHHMQAHALTPRLVSAMNNKLDKSQIAPEFPFLNLLVSGGHSMLVRSENLTSHSIVASTSDIAVGNCIDHIAKVVLPQELLQSNYAEPYGAKLETFTFPAGEYDYEPPKFSPKKRASTFTTNKDLYIWNFPVPFRVSRGAKKANCLEYSFAGVRVFAEKLIANGWDQEEGRMRQVPRGTMWPRTKEEDICIARDAMRVAFEHLASRVVLALESEKDLGHTPSQTLVVSGGVASNGFLKHVTAQYLDASGFGHVQTVFPPVSLCTDNAAMIGWTGCEMWEAGFSSPLSVLPTSKWSLESLISEAGVYTASPR